MPIITTPPQQGQSPQAIQPNGQPTTIPSRLQTAFTPTKLQPLAPVPSIVPPPPPQRDERTAKSPNIDDLDFDDDNDDMDTLDVPSSTSTPKSPLKAGVSLSRMSEDDRRKVITSVFSLVLGRAPADRDFSYYRFSTLTEEGLLKSLLNLPEHKKLVEKANEHTSLKQSVSELDLQVKQLTEAMNSMKQELITMQQLLVEKNRYIQQMRGIPESNMQPAPKAQEATEKPSMQVQETPVRQQTNEPAPEVETRKLPGPFDELKNLIKGTFSKR